MKILILKPSSLGDVVQALPVLRLLKKHYPTSEIFWWVDSKLSSLLDGDPDLAGVLKFHRHRWREPSVWLKMWQTLRWVRDSNFDIVIDLQCLARTGMFGWLANGKLTIGLDEPREGARGFYDYAVQRRSFTTHAVSWYLGVLRVLNVPIRNDFEWLPERPQVHSVVRKKWGVGDKKWVLVQPGARWINKRWPIAHFRIFVSELAKSRPDLHFAVMGGAEDRGLGAQISTVEPGRILDLTGELSLQEMVEWVRLSTLIVTNDTGPMHVAAAVRTPVVGLFGPTEPKRTGAYGQLENCIQLDLPCVPCMSDRCHNPRLMECLDTLSPSLALSVARRLLDGAERRKK